jgi:hypothetical protein
MARIFKFRLYDGLRKGGEERRIWGWLRYVSQEKTRPLDEKRN